MHFSLKEQWMIEPTYSSFDEEAKDKRKCMTIQTIIIVCLAALIIIAVIAIAILGVNVRSRFLTSLPARNSDYLRYVFSSTGQRNLHHLSYIAIYMYLNYISDCFVELRDNLICDIQGHSN